MNEQKINICYGQRRHGTTYKVLKEKLKQVQDKIQELTDEQGYWGSTELLDEEEYLLKLLEEEI